MLADQVQQQVQRALERVQIDFKRIRRDIEILRNGIQLFAIDPDIECELRHHWSGCFQCLACREARHVADKRKALICIAKLLS
ncbi:RAQPRD family integrative conjugative element protein [Methylobacillus sp.]|uniref:RAQPRD family integrative conjugative element protein n=1 Tax=Methylobacillus sp. TaxID=56818 RepID=UPI00338F9E73